jgi:recombination protein RecA
MALNAEFRKGLNEFFPTCRVASESQALKVVKTRWPSFNDIILGCGGIPRGRTIEIYSPPSAGKTTVALNIIAEYQKQNLTCAFDDREGTFPGPGYTNSIGLKRDDLIIIDSSDGNDCLFQAQVAFALNSFDLYVIDSVGAILPRGASTVDNSEGLSMNEKLQRASLLTGFYSQIRSGYRIGKPGTAKKDGSYNIVDLIEADKIYTTDGKTDKYLHKLSDKDTTLIMINHQKTKPGQSFGDATTTAGGDSGKFDASIRIRITYKKKSSKKDKSGRPAYKVVEIRADKNKVAPPHGAAEFLLYQDGRLEEFDKSAATDVVDVEPGDLL